MFMFALFFEPDLPFGAPRWEGGTEANNTDAGKSTFDFLLHEQWKPENENKAEQNTIAQTNRSFLLKKKIALET